MKIILKILIGILFSLNVSNANSFNIDKINQFGFNITDVVVDGNYSYTTKNIGGLSIHDISDKTNPILIGSYVTDYYIHSLKIIGNYVYIASQTEGLVILDISNKQNPTFVSSYKIEGSAYSLEVIGDYAYMIGNSNGLVILDISNKTNISFVGSYNIDSDSHSIKVINNYAYITNRNNGLVILDITNKTNPTFVKSYYFLQAYGLDIVGDYAYVTGSKYIKIINISDKNNLKLVGDYTIYKGYAHHIKVIGENAYVSTVDGGMIILNIKDKKSPLLIEHTDNIHIKEPIKFYSKDNYIYIVDLRVGLHIIKNTDIDMSIITATINTYGSISGIEIIGDYAYLLNPRNGLFIVNIKDKNNIFVTGFYSNPNIRDIDIKEDYAYIGTAGNKELLIVNISDKTNPYLVGSYEVGDDVPVVTVNDNYAYIYAYKKGLRIIDISDKQHPILVGSYTIMDIRDISIIGNYIYIASNNEGLTILDISDKTHPTFVSSYKTPSSAVRLKVIDNYAYIADMFGGLIILDISDKTKPVFMSSYNTKEWITDLAIIDNTIYLANYNAGVIILNISNKKMPYLIGSEDKLPVINLINISKGYIYAITTTDKGFYILKEKEKNIGNISLSLNIPSEIKIFNTYTLDLNVSIIDGASISNLYVDYGDNTYKEIDVNSKTIDIKFYTDTLQTIKIKAINSLGYEYEISKNIMPTSLSVNEAREFGEKNGITIGKNQCIDNPTSCGINTSTNDILTAPYIGSLSSKWTLTGTSVEINDLSRFDNVKIIWIYNNSKWSAYSPDSTIQSKIKNNVNINLITQIPANSGVWILKD